MGSMVVPLVSPALRGGGGKVLKGGPDHSILRLEISGYQARFEEVVSR